MEQRGNIDYDQIQAVARQGEGQQFQMYGGDPGSPPISPTEGYAAIYDGDGNVVSVGRIIIGFGFNSGAAASPAAPNVAAPHPGVITQAILTVTASDPSVSLVLVIQQNGSNVFTLTLAGGTAPGVTVYGLLAASYSVAAYDVFLINITGGSASWVFTIQLAT